VWFFVTGCLGKDAVTQYSLMSWSKFGVRCLHTHGITNESRPLGVRCLLGTPVFYTR